MSNEMKDASSFIQDVHNKKSKISKFERLINILDNYYLKILITGFAVFIAYLFYLFGYSFIYGYYFGGDEKNINPLDVIVSQIPFDVQYISALGVIIFIITLIIIVIIYNIAFRRGIMKIVFLGVYGFILYSLFFLLQFIDFNIVSQLLNLLIEGSIVAIAFIVFLKYLFSCLIIYSKIKDFLKFIFCGLIVAVLINYIHLNTEFLIQQWIFNLAILASIIILDEYLLIIFKLIIIIIFLLIVYINLNLYTAAMILMFYKIKTYIEDGYKIENIIRKGEDSIFKKIKLLFEKTLILSKKHFTKKTTKKVNKDNNDIDDKEGKKLFIICVCIFLLTISLLIYIILFSLICTIGNKIGSEVSLNKLSNIEYYVSNTDGPVIIKGVVVKQLGNVYYISTEERELKIISTDNIIISPYKEEKSEIK